MKCAYKNLTTFATQLQHLLHVFICVFLSNNHSQLIHNGWYHRVYNEKEDKSEICVIYKIGISFTDF